MNFRDVEFLSAYLDGQTSPSDLTRLESRLASDPELAATLQALRESRGLLRHLPKRRAPRNFTLTPKMVGQKPPLPRSYPVFRFATALAAILFVFTYATNQVSMMASSAPQAAYGIGGGSGGGDGNDVADAPLMESMPASTEAPTEAPTTDLAMNNAPTSDPAADAARAADEPPAAKNADAPLRLSFILMIAFAVITLLGSATMFLLQRLAAKKWRA